MLVATDVDDRLAGNVAAKIRYYREIAGLTRTQLAALAGLTRQQIYCVETRKNGMTLESAARLARVLRVKVDDLL